MDFDPAQLSDAYAPHGEEIQQLAATLGKIHALALQGFESQSQRSAKLRSLGDALGGFGISLGEFSETRGEVERLNRESHELQQGASQHALKCLLILDKLLEARGVDPDERSRLSVQSRHSLINSLPESMREPWSVYFDQVEMALVSRANETAPAARPRL